MQKHANVQPVGFTPLNDLNTKVLSNRFGINISNRFQALCQTPVELFVKRRSNSSNFQTLIKPSNSSQTLCRTLVKLLSNSYQTLVKRILCQTPVKLLVFAILLFFSGTFVTKGQQTTKELTLDQVIDLARDQSLGALVAKHRFRASYWEFRSYKARYLPRITLQSDFPQFSRALKKYQNPDGSYSYVEDNVNTSTLDLTMQQNIGLTGGYLRVNTDLQRIDQFGENRAHFYRSSPVSISYHQPNLFYNEYRWEKEIEPLKYQEARKEYLASLEEVTIQAVNYFFDLLLAQKNLEIARANYANADTLYRISQKRYEIGTIAENELMNMKLSYLNAETNRNEARVNLQGARIRLRSFLGFNENVALELTAPSDVPDLTIDASKATELAVENNPQMVNFKKQLLQARQNVAQAKANKGLNADLFARFGLTQQATEFSNVYKNPQNQESITVGMEVPLADWGRAEGRYRMAQSSQEVTKANVEQSKREFRQNVALRVMKFNLQDDQVEVKEQANQTAQQRYDITRKRFLVGKISVLELNDASRQQDESMRNYIQSLRNFWQDYYEIRRMTLYDFMDQQKLTEEFDELHE